MNVIYTGRRRAAPDRPSCLEVRSRLATPGYIGIRHRPTAAVTKADTATPATVTR